MSKKSNTIPTEAKRRVHRDEKQRKVAEEAVLQRGRNFIVMKTSRGGHGSPREGDEHDHG